MPRSLGLLVTSLGADALLVEYGGGVSDSQPTSEPTTATTSQTTASSSSSTTSTTSSVQSSEEVPLPTERAV